MSPHFYRLSKERFKLFADLVPGNSPHESAVASTAQDIKAQKLIHSLGSGMASLWFQESCFAAVCLLIWGTEVSNVCQLHMEPVITDVWRWKATWFCNRNLAYASADGRQEEQEVKLDNVKIQRTSNSNEV